ncbi:MAG: VOC family protein [Tabrizicola sp.]|uniref:VOC family protein n=1 Tax=Tabrizicola sp. TaxID=2005166 RepID=UPI002AB859B5|nr:VOC family protein [Tabrizicola sp.]MDZ4086813.1 VOC family protein [Tabrizicola sp.]
MTRIEHVNVTVSAPVKTARVLCRLFGWHVRWQGPAKMGGFSVHVGTDAQYLALFSPPGALQDAVDPGLYRSGLNHIGVVVDDLDRTEALVLAAGYLTGSHADYDPGRRFYFTEENGVEIEVVSYG